MLEIRNYETVIGLEVHVELKTESKIFCSCSTRFGAEPNTQCCPVCAGLPGALPTLNRRAVELAVTAGLALGCEISPICRMDRKHYFYPDLPKAYQISQAEHPVCRQGELIFSVGDAERRIGITRIHIEEDAGKLIHEGARTLVDCNRCGVPLIEIVSEPDLRSGAEAAAYLRELRSILVACGVSDCRMQEGAMRCDVNLSIRPRGESAMGTRTEIKNLNSFSFVEKAIEAEARRQLSELECEGRVKQRTLRFLPGTGKTEIMRDKEEAADYRFLPEPDLPPFRISQETVERLRDALPELPAERRRRLQAQYGVSERDSHTLTATAGLSDYFETVASACSYPKIALGLLLTDLLRLCEDEPFRSPVSVARLAELVDLTGEGTVNRSTAKKLLLRLADGDFSPREIAEREGLAQIQDPRVLSQWISEILAEEQQSVSDYLGGKQNALKALQGRLMAKSGGRADPITANAMLLEAIEKERYKEDSDDV